MRSGNAVIVVEIRSQLRAFANLLEKHVPLGVDIHVVSATEENHFPVLEEGFHLVVALPLYCAKIFQAV